MADLTQNLKHQEMDESIIQFHTKSGGGANQIYPGRTSSCFTFYKPALEVLQLHYCPIILCQFNEYISFLIGH